MPKANKQQITAMAEKGLQALQTLSFQFVSHLIEEGFKGVAIDKIVNSFVCNRAKIVSGVLGSAGLATGAWAAISLWTSSLGLWGILATRSGWCRCQCGYRSSAARPV